MIELSLNELLILTIVLGLFSVLLTRKIAKIWISAATAYWISWTFVLIGTSISINNNWIGDIGKTSIYYLMILHLGAFVGFLIGSFLSIYKINTALSNRLFINSVYISNKISNKVLIVLFILGVFFLAQRIRRVGLSVNYFEDVRTVYQERNIPFIEWISTHLSVLVGFLVILVGVRDARFGLNVKELVKVLIATAPLALANGSRIFILHYFILYFSSFILYRQASKIYRPLLQKKETIKIALTVSSLLIIFAIIGFARGGYGEKFDFFYTVLIWPVSTMGAMDSWISAAIASTGTDGLYSLGWFGGLFHRIGIIDYSQAIKTIDNSLYFLQSSHNSAAFIPKSILPELIFDFGSNGVFWGILISAILLQIVTIRFVGKGVFLHTLAVLCLVGSFSTIQQSVISPVFAATFFWSLIFTFIFKYKFVFK